MADQLLLGEQKFLERLKKHGYTPVYDTYVGSTKLHTVECPTLRAPKAIPFVETLFRQCTTCFETKFCSDCYKKRGRAVGLMSICIECNREESQEYWVENKEDRLEYQKQWNAENSDKLREAEKRWRDTNPEKVRQKGARRRATKAGIPVVDRIDRMEVYRRSEGICQYCFQHVDLQYTGSHSLAPSIDHIIPVSKPGSSESYGNVQLMHFGCNARKGNKIFDEKVN